MKFLSFLKYFSIFSLILCIIIILISNVHLPKPDTSYIIALKETVSNSKNKKCTYHTCVDVYPCSLQSLLTNKLISVYIYPEYKYAYENKSFISPIKSLEFNDILSAIYNSKYYTNNPSKACIFIPHLDLLNGQNINKNIISRMLNSHESWNNGINHLLFNMLPGTKSGPSTALNLPMGLAMLAGSGFSSISYRSTFDVSIPTFNPYVANQNIFEQKRIYNLIIPSWNREHKWYSVLDDLLKTGYWNSSHLLVLEQCNQRTTDVRTMTRCKRGVPTSTYSYPQVLGQGVLCAVIRDGRNGESTLFDVMKAGCVPLILDDTLLLPFREVIDWKRCSIRIRKSELINLAEIIERFSSSEIEFLRGHVTHVFNRYMSTMGRIALTTLDILNDRVFPTLAKSYSAWNELDYEKVRFPRVPLFYPQRAPTQLGFTAVVLTFDRFLSLSQLLKNLSRAPSLRRIIVVWNNPNKPPPDVSKWPKLSKSITILQMPKNSLHNRFIPFDEIETEAVLSLDDDMQAFTIDEIEFAFQVWCEHSDRLVGFLSGLHHFDNRTGIHEIYDSGRSNEASIILTGAAFFHKYYGHVYQNMMTASGASVREYIDINLGCEDIAMNFLIAQATRKAVLKVAPPKKLWCANCKERPLSPNHSQVQRRSKCLQKFLAEIGGHSPLKYVDFRVDPVLYDNTPRNKINNKPNPMPNINMFADFGSL